MSQLRERARERGRAVLESLRVIPPETPSVQFLPAQQLVQLVCGILLPEPYSESSIQHPLLETSPLETNGFERE